MVFGPKADVQVSLDRESVLPGDTVGAGVRLPGAPVEAAILVLGGRDALEIREGRVELVCENEYTYRHRVGSGSTRRTKSSTTPDRLVADSTPFLEAGHVAADTPYDATASVTVPATAAPSAEGEITKVRWKIVA